MMLAGGAVALEGAWALAVQAAGIDPLPARVVAGVIASILLVVVTQYGYRTAPAAGRTLVARGVAALMFAAAWGALIVVVARKFPEPLRPIAALWLAVFLGALGRWPRRTPSTNVRFFQDPAGASAVVAPLMIAGAGSIAWGSHPASIKTVWHSLSTSQVPAVQWLGIVVGATTVPFVVGAIATAWRRLDPAWPLALAAFPALGAAFAGQFAPYGPTLYPHSLRIEEQAASTASRWWYGSQMTAAGFYASTLLFLFAALSTARAAHREAPREVPSYRQTFIALVISAAVVGIVGVKLQWADFSISRAVHYDMILFPSAVAFAGLASIHIAAAKSAGKYTWGACASALLALGSFAVAQALPAGSSSDVLELAPFEWVMAGENIPPKQWMWSSSTLVLLAPLALAALVALRGLSVSWKNVVAPILPGVLVLGVSAFVALQKSRQDLNQLAHVFRAQLPADMTLASGPPGSLTRCTALDVDKVLYIGREHITLNGENIASTKDLDSPPTCASIAARVQGTVPRLAFDEQVPFRQTTCLLDALARRKNRVCNVMFVGSCRSGTRLFDEEVPPCTEYMHNNVPMCTEQVLDVDGCPPADMYGPYVALTRDRIHIVEWNGRWPDPWPTAPLHDDGRWKKPDVPEHYSVTLGVTDDTTMDGFMALVLQPRRVPYRLQLATRAATELPKPPAVPNPLGLVTRAVVRYANTEDAQEIVEPILKAHKDEFRRCLEPNDIPWQFAAGRMHFVLDDKGKLSGVWATRNPDQRFAGCMTKLLGEIKFAPIAEPALVQMVASVWATLPKLESSTDVPPNGVRVDPPNEVVYSEVDNWVNDVEQGFGHNTYVRMATLKCLMPMMSRKEKLPEKVSFSIFASKTEARVKWKSGALAKDATECLEELIRRRAAYNFPPNYSYLPAFLAQNHIYTNPTVTFDFTLNLYIILPQPNTPPEGL